MLEAINNKHLLIFIFLIYIYIYIFFFEIHLHHLKYKIIIYPQGEIRQLSLTLAILKKSNYLKNYEHKQKIDAIEKDIKVKNTIGVLQKIQYNKLQQKYDYNEKKLQIIHDELVEYKQNLKLSNINISKYKVRYLIFCAWIAPGLIFFFFFFFFF